MFIYIIKLYLLILVKIVNVDTNFDSAIFWSGKDGYIISKMYAEKNNKVTLEIKLNQTIIGKIIIKILENHLYIEQKKIWEILSKRFAINSKGNINVFISNNNVNSIWHNIEKQILLSNKNIKSITILNLEKNKL